MRNKRPVVYAKDWQTRNTSIAPGSSVRDLMAWEEKRRWRISASGHGYHSHFLESLIRRFASRLNRVPEGVWPLFLGLENTLPLSGSALYVATRLVLEKEYQNYGVHHSTERSVFPVWVHWQKGAPPWNNADFWDESGWQWVAYADGNLLVSKNRSVQQTVGELAQAGERIFEEGLRPILFADMRGRLEVSGNG